MTSKNNFGFRERDASFNPTHFSVFLFSVVENRLEAVSGLDNLFIDLVV